MNDTSSSHCAEFHFETGRYISFKDNYYPFCFYIRFSEHLRIHHKDYQPLFSIYGEDLDIQLGKKMLISDGNYITAYLCLSYLSGCFQMLHT